MSVSLYDLLKKEVKQMVIGIGKDGQGNIHPLIIGEIEKYLIELVLQETDYNYVVASKMLGISRSTLYRKIELLKIPEKI
ncbi:MAG: helix-turn-helix domain-containing protein [bacterium]